MNAKPGTAASFGFANVTQNGASLVDFGKFVGMVTDDQVPGQSLNRFALAMTQKLCFFASSAKCEETDPEMRRVALAFQSASFDFKVLVRELFSSPLVTGTASTATFVQSGVTISIARRDQLCSALSNRLGKTVPVAKVLAEHYAASVAAKARPTSALRSTFSAACQSPTTLSFGI